MKAQDCLRFDFCSSPICPMDEQSLELSNWLPDDEICSSQEFSKETWILNQRKLHKKVRNRDFYFTHEMLCRNCVITAATEGCDPDNDYADQEKYVSKWLADHPSKRVLSDEERVKRRVLMLAARQGLSPRKKDAIRIEKRGTNG